MSRERNKANGKFPVLKVMVQNRDFFSWERDEELEIENCPSNFILLFTQLVEIIKLECIAVISRIGTINSSIQKGGRKIVLKRIGICRWVCIIVAVIIVVAGGCKMFENYVSIRDQHLTKYSYSSGGGMDGGYHRETIKEYGDYALVCIESAEWYAQDPTVTEYLTDAAALDELEAVVRKYKMNFWNRKKFTNEFVADGESESYRFAFDDEDISFSSQIYPMNYRKKLAELDEVVKRYIETGEKLPGLVNTKTGEEGTLFLSEGELIVYVRSYAMDSLELKILNGTDEDIEISEMYKLVNADTNVTLSEEKTPYSGSFSEHSTDELNIRLKERLQAGNYKIILGSLEFPFEIR